MFAASDMPKTPASQKIEILKWTDHYNATGKQDGYTLICRNTSSAKSVTNITITAAIYDYYDRTYKFDVAGTYMYSVSEGETFQIDILTTEGDFSSVVEPYPFELLVLANKITITADYVNWIPFINLWT
jgi:hypothetical protein